MELNGIARLAMQMLNAYECGIIDRARIEAALYRSFAPDTLYEVNAKFDKMTDEELYVFASTSRPDCIAERVCICVFNEVMA